MNSLLEFDFTYSFGHLQKAAYAVSKAHGFHESDTNPFFVPTALALIGTEVAEAVEAHRKKQMDNMPSELADIIIRTMDLAETLNIDLAAAIVKKHDFNKDRPFKHGNKLY